MVIPRLYWALMAQQDNSADIRKLFAQQVLAHLRKGFGVPRSDYAESLSRMNLDVEDVYLDDRSSTPYIVILFRAASRPKCQFGFRMAAFDDELFGEMTPEEITGVRAWANIIFTNLEEIVVAKNLGLPTECSEQEITWIE